MSQIAASHEFLLDKRLGANGAGRPASDNTLASYKTALKLAERLADKKLHQLEDTDVQTILLGLNEKSVATRNLTIGVLRQFFDWALLNDHQTAMKRNAFRLVSAAQKPQAAPKALLTEPQFVALLAKIGELEEAERRSLASTSQARNFRWANEQFSDKYQLLLKIMFYGGCRISEARLLRKDQVAVDHLRVLGKNSKYRYVPLAPRLMQELHDFIAAHPKGPWVFYGEVRAAFLDGEAPLSDQRLYRVFREACDALGLSPELTPHSLRHSFATNALRATGRLEVVQDLLGHADPATTRIYAQVQEDQLRSEYAKIYA